MYVAIAIGIVAGVAVAVPVGLLSATALVTKRFRKKGFKLRFGE